MDGNDRFRLVSYLILFLIALTGVISMFGPRPQAELTTTFKPPASVGDLDAYLAEVESRVASIRPGLEKQIIWANPATKSRTPISIVYLHGFSASKGEIRPVPDMVARELGANLFFTRLTGHGADGPAMGTATVRDWMNDVAQALWIGEQLGERTVVISTSTGGTLITPFLTDSRWSPHVSAVVFVSPNFGLKARGSSLMTAPFAGLLVRMILGENREMVATNDVQKYVYTTRYPAQSLLPMAALVKAVQEIPFQSLTTPALFYYAQDDMVVDAEKTNSVYQAWGGQKAKATPGDVEDPSRHVIAGDAFSPSGTNPAASTITNWLKTVLKY